MCDSKVYKWLGSILAPFLPREEIDDSRAPRLHRYGSEFSKIGLKKSFKTQWSWDPDPLKTDDPEA